MGDGLNESLFPLTLFFFGHIALQKCRLFQVRHGSGIFQSSVNQSLIISYSAKVKSITNRGNSNGLKEDICPLFDWIRRDFGADDTASKSQTTADQIGESTLPLLEHHL